MALVGPRGPAPPILQFITHGYLPMYGVLPPSPRTADGS